MYKNKEKLIEAVKLYTKKCQDITVKMGSEINRKNYWKQQEIVYLMDNYREKTKLQLAIDLGRTYRSVKGYMYRNNIKGKMKNISLLIKKKK